MKYETPELTALTAINAVQITSPSHKVQLGPVDNNFSMPFQNDVTVGAYADWE